MRRGGSSFFALVLLPLSRLETLASCSAVSTLYFVAVSLGGNAAHKAARDERLAYEASGACAAQCPTTQASGGQGETTLTIDVLATSGSFPLTYEMYSVPDGLEVFYEGATLYSTGGLVSGSASIDVAFSGTTTIVRVKISAPLDGTLWTLDVGCAVGGGSSSSTVATMATPTPTPTARQAIVRQLCQQYGRIGAAAVAGNIDYESGHTFDYQVQQVNGPARGLFQFEPPMWHAYETYLVANGAVDAASSQLDFVASELRNGNVIGAGNARAIRRAFVGNDVDVATAAFVSRFERPNPLKAYLAARQVAAR